MTRDTVLCASSWWASAPQQYFTNIATNEAHHRMCRSPFSEIGARLVKGDRLPCSIELARKAKFDSARVDAVAD